MMSVVILIVRVKKSNTVDGGNLASPGAPKAV